MPEVPLEILRRSLREEYFESFLPAGGGTVKILVADDRVRRRALDEIFADAEAAGVTVFDLTADDVLLHKMDAVWSAIARKVDWDGLTDQYLRKICADIGFPMDDPGVPCTLDQVCATYDVTRSQVTTAYQAAVRDLIFRDYGLDIDYRKAMTVLVHGAFSGSENFQTSVAKSWLNGEDVLARDLREIQIFQRIDRTRSRSILYSFIRSRFLFGLPTAFVLDGSRYYTERTRLGTLRFTRLQLFDLFELVREFIDEADRLHGAAIIFTFPQDFVESERRSFDIYRALYSRIADDVRGRDRANPCAALLRVTL